MTDHEFIERTLLEAQDEIARLKEENYTNAMDALEMCWEIEKLPASEQQTKVSVMAASLHRRLNANALYNALAPAKKDGE